MEDARLGGGPDADDVRALGADHRLAVAFAFGSFREAGARFGEFEQLHPVGDAVGVDEHVLVRVRGDFDGVGVGYRRHAALLLVGCCG